MLPVRALVFDFDGVLADSEGLHLRSYQQILEPAGVRLTKDIYCQRYLGYDDEGMLRRVVEDFGLMLGDEEIELLIEEKARRFEALIATGSVLYPAAVPCVRRLRDAYPLGIASGALRHEIEHMLAGSEISGAFKFIVSANDTDKTKPDPDPYLLAAERHGVPPGECLAIEDSHWGLLSARTAGLRTMAVTTTYPRAALVPHADIVIDSLDELTLELIGRL